MVSTRSQVVEYPESGTADSEQKIREVEYAKHTVF